MYIPKSFKQEDTAKAIAFMQSYNFATLVSIENNIPIATHLPFIIETEKSSIILSSHLSKTNNQWKSFTEHPVLVIFAEPHAYISPTLYQKKEEVPTWNYIAVHAYGTLKILTSTEEKLSILHKQMLAYEPSYLEQFKTLRKEYVDGLLNGIIAFEISVADLQAKEKLSQNKSEKDRLNVRKHLIESEDTLKQALGKSMPD